jgi:hypothetical protein
MLIVRRLEMLSILAAFLAAGQPAQASETFSGGRTAWVFSTVEQSEWCPAGNVRLDLQTGQFAYTARAPRQICNEAGLERPVIAGSLDTERLAPIRAAYSRALSDGLVSQACREGVQPNAVVVSNGGPRILVVATGAATRSARPDDLTCWSDAAHALHDILDETFGDRRRP